MYAKEILQDQESPDGDSIIKPTEFYSDETDKIKWNWFLYELSLSFEIFIRRTLTKKMRKWKIGEREIADFSIYAASEIEDAILNSISGKSEELNIPRKVVESYFPGIKDSKLTGEILDALDAGLTFQLDSCSTCLTRCLTQREQYCTMFDRGPYG